MKICFLQRKLSLRIHCFPKAEYFNTLFFLDGKKVYFSFHFQGKKSKKLPLTAIYLNDKVILGGLSGGANLIFYC